MNFYLTLPSNASTQFYPENKPGHHKVKLPRNIFLPENDWEVALASISFPDMVTRVDDFIDARVPSIVCVYPFSYQSDNGCNFLCLEVLTLVQLHFSFKQSTSKM